MTLPAPIDVGGIGPAELVTVEGELVAIHAPGSSPPGSTLSFTLGDGGPPFRLKVRGCRRLPDAPALPFRIEGRLFDLTRAQRAALTAAGSRTD